MHGWRHILKKISKNVVLVSMKKKKKKEDEISSDKVSEYTHILFSCGNKTSVAFSSVDHCYLLILLSHFVLF